LNLAHTFVTEHCLPVWACILADSQYAGRGQLRRTWTSPPGNIYAALRLPRRTLFASSAAAPVVGALLVEAFARQGIDLLLKWPNDLLLRQTSAKGTASGVSLGKVGGVLLEERGGALIAGIGVNVLSAPSDGDIRQGGLAAACLNDLPHSNIKTKGELLAFWSCLVDSFILCYRQWEKLGMHAWRAIAEQQLVWKGTHVLLDDGEHHQGIWLGLAASGGIRLFCDGAEKEFLSGSLSPCPLS